MPKTTKQTREKKINVHELLRLNILLTGHLSSNCYRFKKIKISVGIFIDTNSWSENLYGKGKELNQAKQFWKRQICWTQTTLFQDLLKATAIKTVWDWWKHKHTDQCNSTESRNRCIQIWSIDFWQRCKGNQWRKDCLFNKWYRKS